jgi:plastocyanin
MTYPLLLISLFILFLSPNLAFSREGNEFTILMDEESYRPQDLTIYIGDTVIFKNISSQDHWPASNIHPTHEIYPEFDAGKPITAGGQWKFRFVKGGEWLYHDHLQPSITGKIIVKERPSTDDISFLFTEKPRQSILAHLKNFLEKLFSFSGIFKRSVKIKDIVPVAQDSTAIFNDPSSLRSYIWSYGAKKTIKRLHELSAQFGDCHQATHRAGRFAYEFFKEKAFIECSAECHSGCYHGAMEAYFRDHGTTNLGENLNILCGPVTNSFFKHQCIHGLGHGLMAWANYEIYDALKACDLLPEGRQSCYTGVFMENIVGGLAENEPTANPSKNAHFTKYLNDDPQFPCTVVDEKYKDSCYFLQTSRMVKLYQGDFRRIAQACLGVPEKYRRSCFQSMGRDVGGANRGNPSGALKDCKEVSQEEFRKDCLIGAVQDYFWDSSGQDNAITFCKLLTEAKEKESCYRTIFKRAPSILSSSDLKRFCQKAEKPYEPLCLSYQKF